MKARQLLSAAVVAGIVLLALLGNAAADLYFESEQTSQGIPGQQPGTSIVKQYVSHDGTTTDMGDRITIFDFKEKMMYDLDKTAKTYTRSPIDKMGMPAEGATGPDAEQAKMMQQMMKSMAGSIKVTPTGIVETIGGYKCRKYVVNMMMAQSDYWATKEFKGYDEMKEIAEKAAKVFEANPMMKQMNIMGLMKELDGFPIKTATQVMGGSIVTVVKKIEQKKLDKDLFKVPAGYKLVAQ
ncbi:MAG: DUF4412 domain-containing protein [Desulfatitalea sp.]